MATLFQKFSYWKFPKTRMEAFSDAVFAIIITLLVLEIKVPHLEHHASVSELADALWGLMPKIVSWVISFLFIAVMWLHHHNLLLMATQADYGMLWINNLLLMTASFVPFPTALAGEYPNNRLAVLLLGGILALTTFLHVCLYRYIAKHYLSSRFDKTAVLCNVKRAFWLAPALITIATILSFVHSYIPYIVYLIIPAFFLLPLDKENSTLSAEMDVPIPPNPS